MNGIDSLLKISDYPFAYSVTIIIFIWAGVNSQDSRFLSELGIAGSLGTFLAITDPLGKLFKFEIKYVLKKQQKLTKDEKEKLKLEYRIRGIKTKSIGVEIDKTVGLVYFSFVLFLFILALNVSTTFLDQITPKNDEKKPIWEVIGVKIWSTVGGIIILIILAVVSKYDWKEIGKHVETVGIYEYGISSPSATRETIERMRNPVDQNDWSTAEEWARILENEIMIQKGRKEVVIQLVQEVFRPLYLENLSIEGTYETVSKSASFQAFPTVQWIKIKQEPLFMQIENSTLRNEIEHFYRLIEEYNQIQQSWPSLATEIVNKETEAVFGQGSRDIRYTIRTKQGESAPTLANLIIMGIHPLKLYPAEGDAKAIRLEYYKSGSNNIYSTSSEEDFQKFERLWDLMLDDVKNNTKIQRMKELFEVIHNKNLELKTKYVEEIEKQWKV